MPHRRRLFAVLGGCLLGFCGRLRPARADDGDVLSAFDLLAQTKAPLAPTRDPQHEAWASQALRHMQTIKVGMTRKDLETIFAHSGGLFSAERARYDYRNCMLFHVDVAFKPVGKPRRLDNGANDFEEGPDDVVTSVSHPYLDWMISD